jgi:hypothetical protein
MASQLTDEHELRATVGRFRSRDGQLFVRELTSEERRSIELDNEDKIRAKGWRRQAILDAVLRLE